MAAEQQEWQIAIRYFSEAQEKAPYAPEILFNLGLAESKVPGRELRALAWFHAYLAAAAPNVRALRDECEKLEIRIEAMLSRLVGQAKTMANAFPEDYPKRVALAVVVGMQATAGDVNGAKQLASNLVAGERHQG